MRILQVNKFNYNRGGAEVYYLDVADLLRDAGHTVEMFAMAHTDNWPATYERFFPRQVDFSPPPAGVVGKAKAVSRMMWSTAAARGIAEVLDDFRPDVVHVHNIYHQLSPSILQPVRKRGIAAVMTVHDYSLLCPTYSFLSDGKVCEACLGGHFTQAIRRRCEGGSVLASAISAGELALHTRFDAYGPINVFICPSQIMMDKMAAGGVHPDRLVRLNHFVVPRNPVKDTPGHDVVFIGRLSPEKAVDTLIRAFAHVPPPTVLDVYGDGPDRSMLEDLAREIAPERIRFHGRVAPEDVAAALRGAAVSVVPSRYYENQPLVLIEAYTAGTPVVGTNLGGIAELIRDGETGRAVPVDDPLALAAGITELIQAPERAAAMGLAGRAWMESDFAPQRHLAALEEIYAGAIEHRWTTRE